MYLRPSGKYICNGEKCCVPPSPQLMLELYTRWKGLIASKRLPARITFDDFYLIWRSSRRGENYVGLDDGSTKNAPAADKQLISRPEKMLKGVVRTMVLLVDFEDRPHDPKRSASYFEQMLFGDINVFPTGSMAEYYRRISNYSKSGGVKGIDVTGSVHGWLRMPQSSDFYTSGATGQGQFPRNTQGLADHAVRAALAEGIDFDGFDMLGEGAVTALFIIHSGRGAEQTESVDDFWSLKWVLPKPIQVNAKGVEVRTFLTVPEDCQVGVCAHEWGHLAARWGDYYDTGASRVSKSNGLGNYCLMAAGTWANGGVTPTLPNGMLRMFHQWVDSQEIKRTTKNLELIPAGEGGEIILARHPKRMKPDQFVLIEYRRRQAQDAFLPDEGVCIYIIDMSIENVDNEDLLAIQLLQADGRSDLSRVFGQGNAGDPDDLYPALKGSAVNDKAGESTNPALLTPQGKWTGITVTIRGNPGDATMFVDIEFT